MLALARENQRQAGVENVEWLRGHIKDVPLAAGSVDVVGRALGGPQQPTLPGLVQRARRRQRGLVAPNVWAPQPEAAIQRVQRGKRQVDRRRGRTLLDLQVAAEVPGSVIARERVGQRIALPAIAVRGRGEPRAVGAHVARVLAPRPLSQRPPGKPALE